ncbi:alpha/beta hydrolase [Poseidonibacter lekithochrous]|uniref:alpha/beta fold hydrolase n=1 Tax=Poseidonibacter TaxID=2321187 RepID=UPI001C080A5E|nr:MULTISPECIES: alpha/beta hydrolase [Poseidonibacter]MBU3015077.1 alpha/beta hydrolase [Poseidonibacter lekithochrous]MDO6828373.1 alpha/beta hydrolase [Poseidonibacter sp. 1_MG-2023]
MIKLGHKIIGTGKKNIIVLHELMGNYKNYEPTFPYLNTDDFTFIFVDLRGYGLSKDIEGDYSCVEASNDIKNLITQLELEDVILIAHSMSTLIAQKVALIDSRISKLILITPIPPTGIKLPQIAQDKLINEMNENKNKIEEIVYSASKRHNKIWAKSRIKMAYKASTLNARVGYMKMYLETDFSDDVENIKIPIKIIVGKYDFPIFGIKLVTKLFSNYYKDLEIIECQEAGHYPMLECPVYFASKIEEFAKE